MNRFFIFLFAIQLGWSASIDERGIWHGMASFHAHDPYLARALVDFLHEEKAESVVDFGCGLADYVKALLAAGIYCEGYDGDPDTFQVSGGVAGVADLSEALDLNKKFDWVLSLEVGEHIPAQYERVFIENLARHAKKGIILSWAIQGQMGDGHVNTQNNDYIKNIMCLYGYENDLAAEKLLRRRSFLWWFKNTIMVFRVP